MKSFLSLATYQLCYMARNEENKDRTVIKMLRHITAVGLHPAGRHADHYQDQYTRLDEEAKRRPLIRDLLADSTDALQDVQEHAIVSQSALFEQFVQCWFLNMILAMLEADPGCSLSKGQQRALAQACPFSEKVFPGQAEIVEAFPELYRGLLQLPRMKTNRRGGGEMPAETIPWLSAWAAVEFWKEYRNLIVHQGGIVTSRFEQRNIRFYNAALRQLCHSPLKAGKRLPMGDHLFGAMATAHYRVADILNKHLEQISEGRRGHPESPAAKTRLAWPSPPPSPRMLIEGDHDLSWRWVANAKEAAAIAARRGWNFGPLYKPKRYQLEPV